MSDDWNDTPQGGDDGFMGGESYPALKYTTIGDTYEGRVVNIKKKQDQDYDTGDPITWPNGDPKYVWLFEIEQTNGEIGTVWVRGNAIKAIREAVKEAGSGNPIGWWLKLQHHALGEPGVSKTGKKLNPAKLFRAKLTPAPARTTTPIPADEPF